MTVGKDSRQIDDRHALTTKTCGTAGEHIGQHALHGGLRDGEAICTYTCIDECIHVARLPARRSAVTVAAMVSLRGLFGAACLFAISATLLGCQDYTFAYRETQRVDAQRVNQLVAKLTPVDILFVIDNSPTMREETDALKNNIERFVTALADQDVDFQIGIVTPDVECNSPVRVCSGTDAWSYSCCAQSRPICTELDNNGDGVIDSSDCELGRLQGTSAGGTRIFKAPAEADKAIFVQNVVQAIEFSLHGLVGSSFESGLQAAALAVACSVGDPACSDAATGNAAAAQALNAGFIRDEADLAVLILTDEDDCSTNNPAIYRAPNNAANATDQANHFCSPDECYAYYNEGVDRDGDGLDDWSDPTNGLTSDRRLRCGQTGTTDRSVNPPKLAEVEDFITQLVTYKNGNIGKVRAAGIVSAVQPAANVVYQGNACIIGSSGPSAECGCTAGANDFSCDVTGANGQSMTRTPLRANSAGQVTPSLSGCTTAPGNRYVRWLDSLGDARAAAGYGRDVLVDSICRATYDSTLDTIVNNVIVSSCFDLSAVPSGPEFLTVRLNGETLANVEPGSSSPGWSLRSGVAQICLEGGLRKKVGDRYEILQVTALTTP